MVTILFQTSFRRKLGLAQMEVPMEAECTLEQLLTQCETSLKQPLRSHLINENGELFYGMVLLNGRNVLLLEGLKTIIKPGDEINIFPPAGGG